MATLALRQKCEPRWNWLRISSLSGSFGIHVAAIVMLALPLALPALKPEPAVITATIHSNPPELPVTRIPPEPEPQHQPKTHVQPVHIAQAVVSESSVMAVPVSAPVATISEPSTMPGISEIAPVLANNASLAYESIVEPVYPRESRRRGEQGTVLLRVLVGRNGLPVDIEIAQSSGYRQLDRAAREAVLRWRFRPVQINGVNVEARGLVPIKFDVNRG